MCDAQCMCDAHTLKCKHKCKYLWNPRTRYYGRQCTNTLLRSPVHKHVITVASAQTRYYGRQCTNTLLRSPVHKHVITVASAQTRYYGRQCTNTLLRSPVHKHVITVASAQTRYYGRQCTNNSSTVYMLKTDQFIQMIVYVGRFLPLTGTTEEESHTCLYPRGKWGSGDE